MPENDEQHEHQWKLASWTPTNTFGIGVWICRCSASRRVIYNPNEMLIIDPDELQENVEVGPRAGVWSGQ